MNGPAVVVPKPLYRDPVWDGAADPTLIWNHDEGTWWMLYTSRRAFSPPSDDVAWVHGTDIGVASSRDGGTTWTYRGTALGLDTTPGRHTYWAPEVVDDGTRYHLYLTCIDGVPTRWEGHERVIRHYTSTDLLQWRYQSTLELSSRRVIDACVHGLPTGGYRLWYKDEADGSHTWAADSDDLLTWTVLGPVVTLSAHEGPNVFELDGSYWMLVDEWCGQRVLRSRDLLSWEAQGHILDTSGAGGDDDGVGYHVDVVVVHNNAFVFYFTHPERNSSGDHRGLVYPGRRSSINVARVRIVDEHLECDRDEVLPGPILPLPDSQGSTTEVSA